MIAVFIATVAWGAPTVGVIVLSPSPGARVEVLPRRDAHLIEIGIYDNIEPVHEQLAGRSARFVDAIDVMSVGGGTWFVTLAVTGDDVVLDVQTRDGDTLFVLQRGDVVPEDALVSSSLTLLVEGKVPRIPATERVSTLSLLSGDAGFAKVSPAAVSITRGRWSAAPPRSDRSDHHAIIHQRMALSGLTGLELAITQYILGERYLSLGLARDALMYLDAASTAAPNVPQLHLARAQASVSVGRFDVAATHCSSAHRTGASSVSVLRCLGAVSLGDPVVSPTAIARALLAVDDSLSAIVLASSLLMTDDRLVEVTRLLAPVHWSLPDEQRPLVLLALGDAHFGLGQLTRANQVWGQISTSDSVLSDQLRLRFRVSGLVKSGTASWAAAIPQLRAMSRRSDRIGAESHFLLAQIYKMYGNPEGEARHLRALKNGWPAVTALADIEVRQASLNIRRMAQLWRSGKSLELSAWHRRYWEGSAEPYLKDLSILTAVAQANRSLGLRDEALAVANTVSRLESQRHEERASTLLLLANLYVESALYPEAQASVTYGLALPDADVFGPQFALVSGRAFESLGDQQAAAIQYSLAMTGDDVASEGRRRLGALRLKQERTDESIELLTEAFALNPNDSEAGLLLARALITGEQYENAVRVGGQVQDLNDPSTATAAMQVVRVARRSFGPQMVAESVVDEVDDVWSRLNQVEKHNERLLERAKSRE